MAPVMASSTAAARETDVWCSRTLEGDDVRGRGQPKPTPYWSDEHRITYGSDSTSLNSSSTCTLWFRWIGYLRRQRKATALFICAVTVIALYDSSGVKIVPHDTRRPAVRTRNLAGGGEGGGGQGAAARIWYRQLAHLRVNPHRAGGEGEEAKEGKPDEPPMSDSGLVEAFLADGEPRCFVGDKTEEGMTQRCLPNVFSIGVSKCGTSSLSEWMSHHPRIRFVLRPGFTYLEAHVLDAGPAKWRSTSAAALRDRLAVSAEARDTVLDYTPHYSFVAEAPFRILNIYGGAYATRRPGLKFLVLLREPAARTISSWKYKSDLEMLAKIAAARRPERLRDYAFGRAVEIRPLQAAVEEGIEVASRLSACVSNATAAGGFGQGHEVTSCETAVSGDEGCEEDEECRICSTYIEPWCNPRDYVEGNLFDAHVTKSMYALQLSRWFSVFGRERFKVMFTEDMAADPMGVVEGVLDFLTLDLLDPQGKEGLRSREEWVEIVAHRHNVADPAKEEQLGPQVTPELVQVLRGFFAPHNRALEDLLGVPLPASWQY